MRDGKSCRIGRSRKDDTVTLNYGDQSERWLVAERIVEIADESARADAGRLHRRDEVPIIWAVPLDAVHDVAGRFWAFFPTDTPSKVPGIINAPWKIDFGRSALSAGDFNALLMRAAAELIVQTIPKLSFKADIGRRDCGVR